MQQSCKDLKCLAQLNLMDNAVQLGLGVVRQEGAISGLRIAQVV
jgi:hypothetical protein